MSRRFSTLKRSKSGGRKGEESGEVARGSGSSAPTPATSHRKGQKSHVQYAPEYLKGLPRVTLEIRGAFGKNYYAGNIHGSKHLSYSRQYAKQDRAPLQFVFVNLETRRSDWGKCNILVLTNFGELLGLLYIIRDGSGYVKIDRKKTLGDSVIELVDDPHYVFDIHAHQFIDGEEEGAPGDNPNIDTGDSMLGDPPSDHEKDGEDSEVHGEGQVPGPNESDEDNESNSDDDLDSRCADLSTAPLVEAYPCIENGAGLKISVPLSTMKRKKSKKMEEDPDIFFELIRKVRVNAKTGQRYLYNMMVTPTASTNPKVNYFVARDRHLTASLKSQIEELQVKITEGAVEIERMEAVITSMKMDASEKQAQVEMAAKEARQRAAAAADAHERRYAENEEQLLAEQVKQRGEFESRIVSLETKLTEGSQREQAMAAKFLKKKEQTNVLKKEVLRLREEMAMEKKNTNMQGESLRVTRAELKKLKDALSEEREQARFALVSAETNLADAVAHAKTEAKQAADAALAEAVSNVRAEERDRGEREAEKAVHQALAAATADKLSTLAAAANESKQALAAAASESKQALAAAAKESKQALAAAANESKKALAALAKEHQESLAAAKEKLTKAEHLLAAAMEAKDQLSARAAIERENAVASAVKVALAKKAALAPVHGKERGAVDDSDVTSDVSTATLALRATTTDANAMNALKARCRHLEQQLTVVEKEKALQLSKIETQSRSLATDLSTRMQNLLLVNEELRQTNKGLEKKHNAAQADLIKTKKLLNIEASRAKEAQDVLARVSKEGKQRGHQHAIQNKNNGRYNQTSPPAVQSNASASLAAPSPPSVADSISSTFSGLMSSFSALTKSPAATQPRKRFRPSPGQPRYNAREIATEAHNRKDWNGGWQSVRMQGTDGLKYKIGTVPAEGVQSGKAFVWVLDGEEVRTNEPGDVAAASLPVVGAPASAPAQAPAQATAATAIPGNSNKLKRPIAEKRSANRVLEETVHSHSQDGEADGIGGEDLLGLEQNDLVFDGTSSASGDLLGLGP